MSSDRRGYDPDAIKSRDDYTCRNCGTHFHDGRPLEVAHLVSRANGGSDDPDNLVTLCIRCHSKFDGWEITDFDGTAKRVERVTTYVRHRERLYGAALVSRVSSLLGIDYDETNDLMQDRDLL